jgi:hypothetical protein
VIHCRGHQKGKDKITKGKTDADKAAKQTVMQEYTADPLLWEGTLLPPEIPQYQSQENKQISDQGHSWIIKAGGCPLKGSYGSLRHSNCKFLRPSTNFIIWD